MNDPRNQQLEILRHVRSYAGRKERTRANIDATLIAEAPKLRRFSSKCGVKIGSRWPVTHLA